MDLDYQSKGNSIDRRMHRRLDVDLPLLIQAGDSIVAQGRVENLSVTGLKVRTCHSLEANGDLKLLLKLDYQQMYHHLFCSGQVVRSESRVDEGRDHCYGIRFQSLSPQVCRIIDRYISRQVQDTMSEVG